MFMQVLAVIAAWAAGAGGAGRAASACSYPTSVQTVTFSAARYPGIYQHWLDGMSARCGARIRAARSSGSLGTQALTASAGPLGRSISSGRRRLRSTMRTWTTRARRPRRSGPTRRSGWPAIRGRSARRRPTAAGCARCWTCRSTGVRLGIGGSGRCVGRRRRRSSTCCSAIRAGRRRARRASCWSCRRCSRTRWRTAGRT
jgi:hypothetical protein